MSLFDVKAPVHLRPYQEKAIAEVADLVAAGRRRILVVAATGAGKTVIFSRIVADAARSGQSALVIAHRRELILQTYRKLLDAGLHEGQVGILMANDPRRRPVAPVQVASIDTLRHRRKPPADLVVVDEAHRELARSYCQVREAYPSALHLGFTATPFRADNRGLGEFYEALVVAASIGDLIAQRYLVEPRVFTVPRGQLPNLAGVRVRGGDYETHALAREVDKPSLVGNIVEHWKRHAAGVRTVVFAVSVEHSRHIVERFCAAGIAAEHLDGMTPVRERDAILERLDRGETTVVSNCAALAEGWDMPSVKCAILARPTHSTGLYLQQAGRILRPWQDHPAVILDHAGCAREHGLPQDERELSLETRAKGKGKDTEPKPAPVRVCEQCFAVLPIATRVCPACGWDFPVAKVVPVETETELVLAGRGEPAAAPPRAPKPSAERPRGAWPLVVQRAFFEQTRALARTKKQDLDWVCARFVERYGAQPPPEWLTTAWGIA